MKSFTTQSHQRNYQGNVVVNTMDYQTRLQQKRRKLVSGITTAAMAIAIVITSGLWSATAIHNRQLKQELAMLTTQAANVNAANTHDTTEQDINQPRTLELRPTDYNQTEDQTPAEQGCNENCEHKKGTQRRVPISRKKHDVHPLPKVKNDLRVTKVII